jgi:uncharacterized protein YbaR (Trm112 family)
MAKTQLPPGLLDLVACPGADHAPLEFDQKSSILICTACLSEFPVRDGIPVLLIDEATPGPNGVGIAAS